MYCINCGEKIIEGAKFCLNCGGNVSAMLSGNQDAAASQSVEATPVISQNDEVKKEDDSIKEDIETDVIIQNYEIEEYFLDVFNSKEEFGQYVCIPEYDDIDAEYTKILKDAIDENDLFENLLLYFKYPSSSRAEGFIITSMRFVWDYGSNYAGEIPLAQIKDITIGKSILATVMNIVTFDNKIYRNIYLTGIRNEKEFVMKFRKFIDILNGEINSTNNTEQELTQAMDTDFIVQSCQSTKIDSIYCVVGNPTVSPYEKKYKSAKLYFNIPDREEIFLIYDSTIFGNCKKGFAICTSGIYYCISNPGYWSWDQYRMVNISKNIMGEIDIGGVIFSTANDAKSLMIVFQSLQGFLK
ncbi:MAG: zinc ribbon domain-containing protein [Lachnospiraceae bacterium]|nr:zinc ribbon domain-containing protein [Lachnospiraceae bacterium]